MTALPPETVYRPYAAGPYRMAMDLTTLPEAAWFEIDSRYPAELAVRRRLLADARGDVFAALPVSDAARAEACDMAVAALTTHHPAWFSRSGNRVRNHLTGEEWDVENLDPLELAGRLVQEDLCIIQDGAFTAAVLCFPSRWRLLDKLGKPLADVHEAVPLYADRLASRVYRFMRHLKPGHIASRLNWSLLDDPALFQPTGKWRLDGNAEVTAANAGERVFLRVERQTLRRLPVSDAVLFGIRVHVYKLAAVIRTEPQALDLAIAVRALPEAIQHYKSLLPLRAAVLEWLEQPRMA